MILLKCKATVHEDRFAEESYWAWKQSSSTSIRYFHAHLNPHTQRYLTQLGVRQQIGFQHLRDQPHLWGSRPRLKLSHNLGLTQNRILPVGDFLRRTLESKHSLRLQTVCILYTFCITQNPKELFKFLSRYPFLC